MIGFGRQDGSGKGVGRDGGLRRNQNKKPCPNGGKGKGLGQGVGRGKNR